MRFNRAICFFFERRLLITAIAHLQRRQKSHGGANSLDLSTMSHYNNPPCFVIGGKA